MLLQQPELRILRDVVFTAKALFTPYASRLPEKRCYHPSDAVLRWSIARPLGETPPADAHSDPSRLPMRVYGYGQSSALRCCAYSSDRPRSASSMYANALAWLGETALSPPTKCMHPAPSHI